VIETPRRVYVTDLPVPYGMAGGPVVNADGEAVGVIGYDLDPREGGEIYVRSGYPLIYTADLFQHLIDNPPTEQKDREEAWLGVFTQPLTDDLAEYWGLDSTGGVVVSTVIQDSPAERGGLLRGDIIRMFDGQPVNAKERTDVRDFTRMVRESGVGRTVPVTVLRDGEPIELSMVLEEAPKTAAEAEKYQDEDFGLTVREITADFIIVGDLDPGIKGLVVDRVEAAGWASLAGLLPGDIVKEFGGKQVTSIEGLKSILEEIKGDKPKEVAVFIERRGRTGFLRIEPDWDD
jgi:serine protease Do